MQGQEPRTGDTTISTTSWRWARLAGGVAILAVLFARFGTAPFLDALRLTSPSSIAAALAITALTTVCCAWRWSIVGGQLGVDVPLRGAVAAYYRSQFLNATLPGGVVGDVHRAIRHGRDTGDLALSARSVAWERAAGQTVQLTLTALVLAFLPSPLRSQLGSLVMLSVPAAVLLLIGGVLAAGGAVGSGGAVQGSSRRARVVRTVAGDLRTLLGVRRVRAGIVLSSVASVLGHTLIFVIAARTAGATVPLGQLVPLALLVLLASTIPTNVAGWGPREGMAAWAFASVGLSAGEGVTIAVVYGVMALVATAPGAPLLFIRARPAVRQEAVHG